LKDKTISSKILRTIDDLKPEPPKEPVIAFTVRLLLSDYQKLNKAVDEHGFDKQIIIRKALEAFLKWLSLVIEFRYWYMSDWIEPDINPKPEPFVPPEEYDYYDEEDDWGINQADKDVLLWPHKSNAYQDRRWD